LIPGRFGREATLLQNGQYIKDLSYLNRPIKDIIYVDFEDSKVAYHKDNAIIIPYWDGDQHDTDLIDLIPFLLNFAQKPCDIRKEIQKIGKENTGRKYREMILARRDIIKRKQTSGFSGALNSFKGQ